MIRLSKLTDYAIVLMVHMASQVPGRTFSARELAVASGLPLPTVSKVLKQLTKSQLVVSKQGAFGGYALVRAPRDVSVLEMMTALEGAPALTACAGELHTGCAFEARCPSKTPWQLITRTVRQALSGLTLADMGGMQP